MQTGSCNLSIIQNKTQQRQLTNQALLDEFCLYYFNEDIEMSRDLGNIPALVTLYTS